MIARAWHGGLAVLILVGLVVQAVIAVRAPGSPPGHSIGTINGAAPLTRYIRVVSFFTIESNIASMIVSAQLARHPDRDGRFWRIVRLAALFGITVTGIVYSTVLARVHEPKGWEQVSSNAIFHYVAPLAMVLGWLLFGPRPRISASIVLWSLLFPVAYLGYTLAHGAVAKWYPYPFLNVPTEGYPRVIVNSLVVTVVFGLVAALLALGDRALPPAPRPS